MGTLISKAAGMIESRSFIRYLKNRWLTCPVCQPPLVGCTDDEIEQLRIAQGVERLPALYVEFMRQMGRSDGGLAKSSDADLSYAVAIKLKSPEVGYALPILRSLGLEQESFVFLSDNTNFIYTFDSRDTQADPLVYSFTENPKVGEPYFVKTEIGSFSGVLVDLVEDCFASGATGGFHF